MVHERTFNFSNKGLYDPTKGEMPKKDIKKEPLERGENGKLKDKIVHENSPLNSGENIDFSGKKIEKIYGEYGNDTIKNGELEVINGKIISYSKVKKNFLFEIQEGELILGDKKIKIENCLFSYDRDKKEFKNEDGSINLNFFNIKLDDRKISYNYENGIKVEKRKKKGIVGIIKGVSKKVFNIRNK